MNNAEMKKTAIKASVFALVSISMMLYRSATKHIMITDAAEAHVSSSGSQISYSVPVSSDVPDGKENTLIIPLDRSVSSDNIVLEDGYIDHELRIYIDSREPNFYRDSPVVTDLDIIESAMCISDDDSGKVCLDFKLDNLYANESSLTDNSTIEVKFFSPKEKYEHIVVVDESLEESGLPEGGLQEKDVILDVALLLRQLADKDTDNSVKLYFTRLTGEDTSFEKRQALIVDSGADMFVELSVDGSKEGTESCLIAGYNDSFFLRRLSNAEFADIMLRNCALKTGTEGKEIVPAGEEDLLIRDAKIPSVKIEVSESAQSLADQGYRKKLAEGIYSGILEAFEVME